MSEKTKRILITGMISYCILVLIIGIVSPIVLSSETKKSFENYARSYFSENEKLEEEVGEIYEYKCLGRKSEREADGLPVCFEVKAEKGDYYVVLWFETVSFEPMVNEVVKHRVTTSLPEEKVYG